MKIYKIKSDGVEFVFQVTNNLTEPCPQCGVPACGKEDILWYELDGQKISLIFDGGMFDLIGEDFFSKYLKTNDYNSLPVFMKEWNEHRGWEDNWDYNGHLLEVDDFLHSLDLIVVNELSEWLQKDAKEYLCEMKSLAQKAKELNAPLKIVRG